ncbi:hypothetical protein COOONC_23932 [Cooperia oncophora]
MAAAVELLPPPEGIRFMMSFTYLILSIIGLIPNIILAITLIKIGSMPKQKMFVLLAEQILISDFCQLSSQLFVAFPLSFYGQNIFEGTPAIWVYNVVNFLDTVGYNGVLDFTFLMAVNRLTVFMAPGLHSMLFDSSNIKKQRLPNSSPAQKTIKDDQSTVAYAVIISFFIELQTLSFTLLPMIGHGNNRFYSSLAQNVISIMNNSSSPYVYFFFNSQIRAGILALVRCKSPKQQAQAVVTTISQAGKSQAS